MMGWKAYRLVYQAKSPVHIGWHTLGYIKLTRYYITGKNMWGAFTANLTRAGEDKNIKAYEDYGKEVLNKDIFISYFYPALRKNNKIKVMMSEYTPDGLKYGDYLSSDFERLFVKSYGQTAVLPESNTAENETLHESEFIASIVEDEKTREQLSVYFVGYVFLKAEAKTRDNKAIGWDDKEIKLKEIAKEIFVGGDRKYGWGRLLLYASLCRPVEDSDKVFDFTVNLKGSSLALEIPASKAVPAHVPVKSDLKFKGDIEPLVGREWGEITSSEERKIGFGQRIVSSGLFWMPGSVTLQDATLQIGPYGILSKV